MVPSTRRRPPQRGQAETRYTVNALMENRHRFLLGLGVETFQGTASEKAGCLRLLDRAQRRLRFTPLTLGADKGFFHETFIEALLARAIVPHIATESRGSSTAHACVRMQQTGWRIACRNGVANSSRSSSARARTGMGWALSPPRSDPGPRGGVPHRLGAEPQTPGQASRPGGPAGMNPVARPARLRPQGQRHREPALGWRRRS